MNTTTNTPTAIPPAVAGAARRGPKYPLLLRSRVSAEEMQRIKESAEIAGMSLCKYVRYRATGQTVVSKLDAKILRELNLIGNWLVKLTKNGYDVSEAIAELRVTIKKIKDN